MTATAFLLLVPLGAPSTPIPTDPPPAAEIKVDDQTLAAWVTDLGGKDFAKRRMAYENLLKAGAKAKSTIPALTKLLEDKDASVSYVAEILGAFGPDAKQAVPSLIATLPPDSTWGSNTWEVVACALAQIDGPKIEATRVLLLSSSKGLAIHLTHSKTLYDYPEQVVSHLSTLCGDKSPLVRERVATRLLQHRFHDRAVAGRRSCRDPPRLKYSSETRAHLSTRDDHVRQRPTP
jgi:hypothetical protein